MVSIGHHLVQKMTVYQTNNEMPLKSAIKIWDYSNNSFITIILVPDLSNISIPNVFKIIIITSQNQKVAI